MAIGVSVILYAYIHNWCELIKLQSVRLHQNGEVHSSKQTFCIHARTTLKQLGQWSQRITRSVALKLNQRTYHTVYKLS